MRNSSVVQPPVVPSTTASEATAYIARARAQASWYGRRRAMYWRPTRPANTAATTAATSGNTHMAPSIRAALRPTDGRGPAYDRGVERPLVLFSSAAFFARPLANTFRIVAETGYRGVEVMVTKDPDSQDPDRMRALASEHELTIGAIHAPSLLVTRKVWGTDPIGKIDRAIQVAERAEVPLVVMHPPYR